MSIIYYEKMLEDGKIGSCTPSLKVAQRMGWESNSISEAQTELGYDGNRYLLGSAPQPPTLHEQAMLLSMDKMTFVELAEALTANMPNPVTFESIKQWMATNPEIEKLFMLASVVRRNDPKLDEVTAMFGAEFLPFLDMMFVHQNEIMAEITAAKAEGRPVNLDALLQAGGVA